MITCDGKEIEIGEIPKADTYWIRYEGKNELDSLMTRDFLIEGLENGSIPREGLHLKVMKLPYLQKYWGER